MPNARPNPEKGVRERLEGARGKLGKAEKPVSTTRKVRKAGCTRLFRVSLNQVFQEQKERLEAVNEELVEVRQRMDRLWHAVETTDLEINDIIPRLREHQERQEKLEAVAEEARSALSNRPSRLDDAKIAAYAQEMGEFLMESELTETKAFIRSFVKEIAIEPSRAIVRYAMPMPEDSPFGERESEEVRIGEPVLATVHDGWGWRIRTSDT